MTLAEFKAWFEGFTEGIESAPTAEQFAKIKAKVEKIDGAATTQTIFINGWYRPYRYPYWPGHPVGYPYSYNSLGLATSQNMGQQTAQNYAGLSYDKNTPLGSSNYGDDLEPGPAHPSKQFDATAAFRDLGRREAVTGY